MSSEQQLDLLLFRLTQSAERGGAPLERFGAEIEFARQFANLFPDQAKRWQALIVKAVSQVADALAAGGSVDLEKIVSAAEKTPHR